MAKPTQDELDKIYESAREIYDPNSEDNNEYINFLLAQEGIYELEENEQNEIAQELLERMDDETFEARMNPVNELVNRNTTDAEKRLAQVIASPTEPELSEIARELLRPEDYEALKNTPDDMFNSLGQRVLEDDVLL